MIKKKLILLTKKFDKLYLTKKSLITPNSNISKYQLQLYLKNIYYKSIFYTNNKKKLNFSLQNFASLNKVNNKKKFIMTKQIKFYY